MGETGALDLSEVNAPEATAPEPTQQVEIEISPLNEDGTPRSRREMRQLREEALAAQAAASGDTSGVTEDEPVIVSDDAATTDPAGSPAEPEDTAADGVAEAADVAEAGAEEPVAVEPVSDEPAAEQPADEDPEQTQPAPAEVTPLTGEMDFDSLISPPTEPFTVDELREAEQATEDATSDHAAAETAAVDAPAVAEAPVAAPAEEATKPKRRFPWQRNRAEDVGADPAPEEALADAELAEAVDAAGEPVEVVVEETQPADAGPETIEVVPEPISATEDDPAPGEDVPTVAVPAVVVPADDDPEALPVTEPTAAEPEEPEAPAAPVSATPAYSFPDIAPPEEWRSVFDDPASRTTPGAPGDAAGDFDDLISRAVAQEGATGSANTSALILPTMPEDTGGLTGPLGGTGELYVTGSLKLPKSLGETGGHSALHDSIEIDPITGAETEDTQMTGQGPAPVSARHAVSARMDSSIPVVAKPAKERSKLPLVLSLTGGGLLVAVVALGIWGASNGMFG